MSAVSYARIIQHAENAQRPREAYENAVPVIVRLEIPPNAPPGARERIRNRVAELNRELGGSDAPFQIRMT